MQAELEEATEKVHEEWRQKRRSEFASLGVSEEVPQWKRIEPHEYGSNGIFFCLRGPCQRRTPRTRIALKVPKGAPYQGLSDALVRLDLAPGTRRRRASKNC